MLARRITTRLDDGEVSTDYIKADIARAPRRKKPIPLTPSQEIALRDQVWVILANQGLSTHEIERACARAAQSERNIRRRLGQFEKTHAAVEAN